MKDAILNMAIWAFQKWVSAYVASGLFERVQQLFAHLASPEFKDLTGKAKREHLVKTVEQEFGHMTSAAGAVARGSIELLYLRSK